MLQLAKKAPKLPKSIIVYHGTKPGTFAQKFQKKGNIILTRMMLSTSLRPIVSINYMGWITRDMSRLKTFSKEVRKKAKHDAKLVGPGVCCLFIIYLPQGAPFLYPTSILNTNIHDESEIVLPPSEFEIIKTNLFTIPIGKLQDEGYAEEGLYSKKTARIRVSHVLWKKSLFGKKIKSTNKNKVTVRELRALYKNNDVKGYSNKNKDWLLKNLKKYNINI